MSTSPDRPRDTWIGVCASKGCCVGADFQIELPVPAAGIGGQLLTLRLNVCDKHRRYLEARPEMHANRGCLLCTGPVCLHQRGECGCV